MRRAVEEAGAEIVPTRGLRFHDPWGNSVEVVEYGDVQFTKADAILDAMDLTDLEKSESAREELRAKGVDA